MSKTLHLLKLYKTNLTNCSDTYTEKLCNGLICVGKINDSIIKDIVNDYNKSSHATIIINNMINNTNTIVIDPTRALTLHRIKLLGALIAQVKGYSLKPSLSQKVDLKATPERFQTKFQGVLVDGFWLLGRMISDSLSEDCTVNCGNPFGFIPGDLAFWWAGCVILDWTKNKNLKCKKKLFPNCYDFYMDISITRKFKYYQNSGNCSFNYKLLQDFLSEKDLELFTETIKNVRFEGLEDEGPITDAQLQLQSQELLEMLHFNFLRI